MGVSFGFEPSKVLAPLVGIDVEASASYSSGVGVGNEHNNVRKGYRARVMIWEAVVRHYGTADAWNTSGYAGVHNYEQFVPDEPAFGMHLGPLEWAGQGPEPEGGSTIQ